MDNLLTSRAGFVACLLAGLAAGFIVGRTSKLAKPELFPATSGTAPAALPEKMPRDASRAPLAEPAGDSPSPDRDQIDEILRQNGGRLSSQSQWDAAYRNLLAWGAIDPEAALAYASGHLTLERKDQAVIMLLSAWVKKDLPAAWDWIGKNGNDHRKFREAALNEAGKVDPDTAWNFAAEVARKHPDQAQTAYLSALQGMMYAGKFDAAIGLVGNEKSPGLKGQAALLTMVAGEWGRYEPLKAMAWAQTLPPNAREQALGGVMESWASVDPKAVAEYAVTLPAGNLREAALTQAVNVWVDQDPEKVNEVATWMNQFNADLSYDPVRFKIATTASVMQDVESALSWANTVTDQELRAHALADIIQNWMARDRAGAENFLRNSSQLSPEMRVEVQSKLGDGARERN